ncbi:hypothetical protein MMAD_40720 [Mycolicibacterium madagascariense]|uniref:Uncharacterized protein n=1 Tax=Mycolicibacterium madagascariense TaxID=212765 RepID=A0A7I7XKQ5_9MYCO|nr:hypothetical protein [Mycolicibacterium madagascariense]MCV7011591.1 hypothetical protein [Mycolicibacterium madagascariense]BBZ29777.1 hypothetical protein MMAD_40720 [Mycolicibacterium madagascariense]
MGVPVVMLAEAPEKVVGPEEADTHRDLVAHGRRAIARRGGLLRRAVLQSPLVSPLDDRRYERRRARHAALVPDVAAEEQSVLDELGTAGVAVRPAELPPDVVASADRLVDALRASDAGGPCVKATSRQLAADPTLFAWGLSDRQLDLAECHIGLPARYLGLEVKRERVASAAGHGHDVVRRWHLDHEDRRILKVIVYLSDVPTGGGPFGYIHRSNSDAILASGHGRDPEGMSDAAMRTVVPADEWNQVTGRRLTAIHVDTGRTFHRVFPPTDVERYSVTFAYSSRTPFMVYPHLMPPRDAIPPLRERFSSRQWDALCVGHGRR